MIHDLMEVDVTKAREFLREQKADTGQALSFTAFLMACLVQSVVEHKAVQAYRQGRKHLVLFKKQAGQIPSISLSNIRDRIGEKERPEFSKER